MGNKNCIAAGKSNHADKGRQVSIYSKDTVVSDRQVSIYSKDTVVLDRQINIAKVQNVILIWLDRNINDQNADCRYTIDQFQCVINSIYTYTNVEQCIQFLKSIDNEKICMITSGPLGKEIMPRVHDILQIDSIFIFCGYKKLHEQWVKEWPKIKGVFTEIKAICEALKKAVQQCEQDAMPISFIATSGDASKTNFDQLEPSFIYIQIFKEILLTIKFEYAHFIEFIDYCHDVLIDNENQLRKVEKFERKYYDETPIWWYTHECFLYSMLNRALRIMNMDCIMKMGFFISDLHRHIEQLHKEQFNVQNSSKIFTVYRGQGMTKAAFERMSKLKNGLISFNNFLLTSKNRNISLDFAHSATTKTKIIGILFVMTINPTKSTTPFASIKKVGYSKDKDDEVLFSINTIFRIDDITSISENHRVFQVTLTLTSDSDNEVRVLMDHVRKETDPDAEGWFRLSQLLLKMGELDKAQQVYKNEILWKQRIDQSEKGIDYHQLGWTKDAQGEYRKAIRSYGKALEIYKKTLNPTDLNLAACYNDIGLVYRKNGDYLQALLSHEKALEIKQQLLHSNHRDLGSSYNNIGNVYDSMGNYPDALSSHKKSLTIRQKSFPRNHHDLNMSYNNIGNLYFNMGDYQTALSYYEKDLEISQKLYPSNHLDLAISFNNIGSLYGQMGEYTKALPYFKKALDIQKQLLSSNHPDLASTYNNIGNLYCNMGDHQKALPSYEKALQIQRQSLPANHPDLASTYNNIGNMYFNIGDRPKALSYYEKVLEIRQDSNHPEFLKWKENFDQIKKKL